MVSRKGVLVKGAPFFDEFVGKVQMRLEFFVKNYYNKSMYVLSNRKDV